MKFIFVIGGPVSSVGKGRMVAALGTLLKNLNFSGTVEKMDYDNMGVDLSEDVARVEKILSHR
jgi:CTP synthase (UTP-ammonia lyase)